MGGFSFGKIIVVSSKYIESWDLIEESEISVGDPQGLEWGLCFFLLKENVLTCLDLEL